MRAAKSEPIAVNGAGRVRRGVKAVSAALAARNGGEVDPAGKLVVPGPKGGGRVVHAIANVARISAERGARKPGNAANPSRCLT